MDTSEQTTIREMTPEESLNAEKKSFQDLVSTADPTEKTVTEGWEIYKGFTLIRRDIERSEPFYNPLCAGELTAVLAEKRYGIISGQQDVRFKETDRNAAIALFTGDTIGLQRIGGNLGVLLRGLESESLDKAIKFCETMNKVGLEPGDMNNVKDKIALSPSL